MKSSTHWRRNKEVRCLIIAALGVFALTFQLFMLQKVHEKRTISKNIVNLILISNSPLYADAIDYIQSFNTNNSTDDNNTPFKKRPLLALHVPKTAGESLEAAARKQNVHWGFCRFPLQPGGRGYRYCNGPPPFSMEGRWPLHKLDFWHIPLQFYPLAGVDPYLGAETFATVRDPTRRLVSEYYYRCAPRLNQCNLNKIFKPRYMNRWLQYMTTKEGKFVHGHFTAQYNFAVGPNEVRMTDHVLRFEHLASDFETLMRAYSLQDIRLEHENSAESNLDRHPMTAGKIKLNESHLTAKTIRKILSVYPNDFVAFGYNQSISNIIGTRSIST